jgi:hypothetical protein
MACRPQTFHPQQGGGGAVALAALLAGAGVDLFFS